RSLIVRRRMRSGTRLPALTEMHKYQDISMPSRYEIQLRHARYYSTVAGRVRERYLQGGDTAQDALTQFDQERAQLDAGWRWAQEFAGEAYADMLLLDYNRATIYISDLRYDARLELIPRLEAVVCAAQRLERRDAEGAALG